MDLSKVLLEGLWSLGFEYVPKCLNKFISEVLYAPRATILKEEVEELSL